MTTCGIIFSVQQRMTYRVWCEHRGERSPIAVQSGCDVLYCELDECDPDLKETDPAAYEACVAAPADDCGLGVAVGPPPARGPGLSRTENTDGYTLYFLGGRKVDRSTVSSLGSGDMSSNAAYILKSPGEYGPRKLIRVVR